MPQQRCPEYNEHKPEDKQGRESRLTNIKVPKHTADLVRVFCIFNGLKVSDFATQVIESELEQFKRKLEQIKDIGR